MLHVASSKVAPQTPNPDSILSSNLVCNKSFSNLEPYVIKEMSRFKELWTRGSYSIIIKGKVNKYHKDIGLGTIYKRKKKLLLERKNIINFLIVFLYFL